MDLLTAIKISASGLSAQRTRINILSSNLANSNSTRSVDGSGPYKRKMPVFQEVKANTFEEALDKSAQKLSGVKVSRVIEDQKPGQTLYDPSHPDADEKGYVQMPNVNPVTELTDIMSTSRNYEANVSAMKAAKQMISAALSIGRSN